MKQARENASTPRELDDETLRAVQRAYASIQEGSGYGRISIRVERAGERHERIFVALERERRTR